jgi:hypothetical protein
MGFFSELAKGLASGGVRSAANYQAQKNAAARPRKKKDECTPCAAMADVDAARKKLGFSTK